MVLLDGIPNKPTQMNEPCPVAECEQEGDNDALSRAMPSILDEKKDESLDNSNIRNEINKQTPQAKKQGLITLSGLPPAHWKNLFHLELVKERNKPIEAPKKPAQAPFFLQWRSGLGSGTSDAMDQSKDGGASAKDVSASKDATDGWDAVWSDNDEEDNTEVGRDWQDNQISSQKKRRKVVHHRSKLAELLQTCFDSSEIRSSEPFSDVTSYLSKMGPSSIDVEISSLCYGMHDLEEGFSLLHLASMWLLKACESRQSFEAVNAYLHRFLYVHGNIIARIDLDMQKESEASERQETGQDHPEKLKLKEFLATISQLREKQKEASDRLLEKMQHSLCLLRHLSRMV